MAIALDGNFKIEKKREEVFDFITDPKQFAPLLPDFQTLEVLGDSECVIQLKLGVSYIRGTAKLKLKLVDSSPPERAAYTGSGSLAGGSVNLKAQFDLEEADAATVVHWKGEATVFGKIASVAGGLLEPLAKKNIQTLIDSLKSSLAR